MKRSELMKRVRSLAVADELLDEAEESPNPIHALIELIVQHSAHADDATSAAERALRDELSGLKPSALRARARELGLDEEEMDATGDSDDPRAALVNLIVASTAEVAKAEPPKESAERKLRAELSALKLSALRKRARAEGVDTQDLDAADDADDVRQAVTELIIAAQQQETDTRDDAEDKPHFGSAPATDDGAAAAAAAADAADTATTEVSEGEEDVDEVTAIRDDIKDAIAAAMAALAEYEDEEEWEE